MSESDKSKERKHRSTSQVMGNLDEFLKEQKNKKVDPVPEIEDPGIADQLWSLVPSKLRNIFLIVCVLGGGSLGGGSIMGAMQNNSPATEEATKTTSILIKIQDSQEDMADLQKEHSKELHIQSTAQAEFNTEQRLHSQAIKGIEDDIGEIKSDVKENRNHDHN